MKSASLTSFPSFTSGAIAIYWFADRLSLGLATWTSLRDLSEERGSQFEAAMGRLRLGDGSAGALSL